MVEMVLTIMVVVYLLLMYAFLLPGLVVFLVEKNSCLQKRLQILSLLVGPPIFPFFAAAGLMIAILAIAFLLFAYPIYWLRVYLPFGYVFKAWYKISARMLASIRELFQTLLGLLFPAFLNPIEPKKSIPLPFHVGSGND